MVIIYVYYSITHAGDIGFRNNQTRNDSLILCIRKGASQETPFNNTNLSYNANSTISEGPGCNPLLLKYNL